MAERISIRPGEGLLKVPKPWRKRFAEESAETVIREGRLGEILQKISGLSSDILAGEPCLSEKKLSGPPKRAKRTAGAEETVSPQNHNDSGGIAQISGWKRGVALPAKDSVNQTISQAPNDDSHPGLF